MASMADFAFGLISRNPRVANNPQAQELIKIIQNGDSEKGARVAQNICDTYGVSKEDATNQAKRFFGI